MRSIPSATIAKQRNLASRERRKSESTSGAAANSTAAIATTGHGSRSRRAARPPATPSEAIRLSGIDRRGGVERPASSAGPRFRAASLSGMPVGSFGRVVHLGVGLTASATLSRPQRDQAARLPLEERDNEDEHEHLAERGGRAELEGGVEHADQ